NERQTRKEVILTTFAVFTGSVIYLTAQFVAPGFRKICLPFLPATDTQLHNLTSMLRRVKKASNSELGPVIDLGSGDGRVLFHLASDTTLHVKQLTGIELNRPLVMWSKYRSWRFFSPHKPVFTFKTADLWKYNLSPYKTVIIFGAEGLMEKLQCKFESELRKEAFVISCRFPLPDIEPIDVIEDEFDSVFLYKYPLRCNNRKL
ncbi:hypothetical protein Ciccas_013950, partial [Cichlidogyrus casuarinus]